MERQLYLNWQDLVEEAIARRKANRLKQEQLAVLVGVSKPTLNRFEEGKTNITLSHALAILHALGLA